MTEFEQDVIKKNYGEETDNFFSLQWDSNQPPTIRLNINCPCDSCRLMFYGHLTNIMQEATKVFDKVKREKHNEN